MRSGRFDLSVALAVGIATTACSADPESSQPIETAAPVALVSTPQPALTTSSEPNAVQAPGEGEPWDLLILMHADDLGVDTGIEYADQLSATLGVEVDMMQPIGIESYVWAITEHVRDRRFPGLSDLVREAEIILLGPFPERLDEGIETYIDKDSRACGFWEAGYTGPTDLYPVLWYGTPNEVGSVMVADALADAGHTRRTEPPVNHFRLIWDGASCTCQGATTIPPGPIGLDFVNTSEDDLRQGGAVRCVVRRRSHS